MIDKRIFRHTASLCWFTLGVLACDGNRGTSAGPDARVPPEAPANAASLERSMKGWELWSWLEGEDRFYSLLAGTNRNKTWAEVSGGVLSGPAMGAVKLRGIETLRRELTRVPRGETIFMVSPGWPGADPQASPHLSVPLAEEQTLIREVCEAAGIGFLTVPE